MITTKKRFRQICRFERCNDPSFFGLFAWLETYHRWVREGMPVDNLENMKQINMHLLGYQDQNYESVSPNAASQASSVQSRLMYGCPLSAT